MQPERQYLGLFADLAEQCDIQQELGCSIEEAIRIQRGRAKERLAEIEHAEKIVRVDFRQKIRL